MRGALIAIVLSCGGGSPTGCCEPPPPLEPIDHLWSADAEDVREVEARTATQRIAVVRDDDDPALAWCTIATAVDGAAPRVIDFPVEGQAAGELFQSVAAPQILETLGELTEARRAELGLDGADAILVTIGDDPPHRLAVAAETRSDSNRAVLDPVTGHAYIVADRWWRTLTAAQRLLPLRKLVERRGLERVTIHARGRTWALALRSEGGWVPEDASVDPARARAIVLDALRLRPGTFDRERDPSALRELVRFEFEGGERPQTLALLTDDSEAFYVRSTRGAGVANVHHLDARALAEAVAQLP